MGGDKALVGWVMGTFSISTVITRPFMACWIERRGERLVIFSGLFIIFVASLGYHLHSSLNIFVYGNRILHGLGFSAFVAGTFTLLGRLAPLKSRGEIFSISGAFILFAMAMGPFCGEFVVKERGFSGLFNVASACTFLSMIVVYFFKGEEREDIPENERVPFSEILHNKSFLWVLLSTLFFVLGQSTILNFLPLYFHQKDTVSGLYFLQAAPLAIIIRLFGGKFIDVFGKVRLIRLSFVLFGIGFLLIPFWEKGNIFLLSPFLYGLGLAYLYPAHNALVADQARSEKDMPAIFSIFSGIFDAAFIGGTILAGLLAEKFGFDMVFYLIAIISFAGAILQFVVNIHEEK
jgi:predicted MFS family arabinose efflux permease